MNKYLFKAKKLFIAFLITSALGAGSVVLMAYVIDQIVTVISNKELNLLGTTALFALLYVILDSYMDYVVEIVNERLIQAIMKQIRDDLSNTLTYCKNSNLLEVNQNEFLNYYSNDLKVIEQDYIRELLSMYNDIWTLIFAVGSSLFLHPIFSAVMIVISCIPMLLPYMNRRVLKSTKQDVSEISEKYLGNLSEIIQGIVVLKVFSGLKIKIEKLYRISEEMEKKKNAERKVNRSVYALSYGIRLFLNLFSWVVGGYFVITNSLSLATFFAIKQLSNYISYPIQGFNSSYTEVVGAKIVVDKIMALIQDNKQELIQSKQHTIQKIKMENVAVVQQDRQLIKDINLIFEKGQKYLIIGPSGSGKSTLLNLVLGLLHPTTGNIFVYDEQGQSILIEEVLENASIVLQKTVIFEGNLRENITLYQKHSDNQIDNVLEKVGLNHFVARKEEQINNSTMQLSGGEERRVDFARCLLNTKSLIVLDEVVSGLDDKNSKVINKVITELNSQILIYVTHYYDDELIQKFDCIIELENGHIKNIK